MSQSDPRFRVSGTLLLNGQPLSAWIELQDDDVVLHDFLAAGRSRPDGSFHAEFPRRAFNQQSWEDQSEPDLVLYVWADLPAHTPPHEPEPPTHCVRFPRDVFVDRVAALGAIELDDARYTGWGWLIRQANTSRRPGGMWTQAEVEELSNQVRTWVMHAVRRDPPVKMAIRLTPMPHAAGQFDRNAAEIRLDPDFVSQLSADGVRRLLAHEWAHATSPPQERSEVELLTKLGSLMPWAEETTAGVDLEAPDVAACVFKQAVLASHEGYAHFVEERVVRKHLPMSAYPVATTWQRAHLEATELKVDPAAYRLWLAQHDEGALRQLGLAWYRHHYHDKRGRVRFEPQAETDLLIACKERFRRLVRGDGRTHRARRVQPWSEL